MELLYAKYNRHRLPAFQIETSIWRDGDRKFVLKKALVPDALEHLQRLREQAAPIRRSLRGECLKLPEVAGVDAQTLRFDFVEGRSLDALLVNAFIEQDQARFMGIIADYQALLQNAFTTVPVPVLTDAMRQIFALTSLVEIEGLGPFLTPALVDLVFENIIVNGDRRYLIDHEWVFEGCLPVSFVLFRSLFYFYAKNKAFGIDAWMPLSTVLERFAILPETVRRYRKMDEAFQSYVFGCERCYRYKERYAKYAYSVPWFLETIENQRKVIAVMQNSRGWQFVQKTGRLMDRCFPPGARRRRFLERILRCIQVFV